jgi:hypothetical protein
LNGDAVQPVAENEVLGEAVPRGEERLLDLRRGQRKLGGGLVDPQSVQLAKRRTPCAAARERDERRDERSATARARTLSSASSGSSAGHRAAADEVDRNVVRDPVERLRAIGHAPAAGSTVGLQHRHLGDVVADAITQEMRTVGGQPVHVAAIMSKAPPRPRRGGCQALIRESLGEERATSSVLPS